MDALTRLGVAVAVASALISVVYWQWSAPPALGVAVGLVALGHAYGPVITRGVEQ
jgi:hypothetical protein